MVNQMQTKLSSYKVVTYVMILSVLLGLAINVSMTSFRVPVEKAFSRVVYAEISVHVSQAVVTAYGDEGHGYAMTDSLGQYVISEGLKTGDYTISVFAPGYLQEEENVSVTVGETTSGVNFYLRLSGGISGQITEEGSELPIENVMIIAFDSAHDYGWMALTDNNGKYHIFTNLATGTYNVSALFPEGYVGTQVDGISVVAGVTTTGVDLQLERSGIISGRITSSIDDTPLEGTSVWATSDDDAYMGWAQTNATGHYRITSGLGTGTYEVMVMYGMSFDQAEDVSVVAGVETHLDFELDVSPPSPSGIITGKVTDTVGQAIEYATVTAQGPGSGYAQTDENGEYVISTGLSTGTYTVTAEAAGYLSQDVTGVSVTIGEVTPNIDFELAKIPPEQSGIISGTVIGDVDPIPEFQPAIILPLIMIITMLAVVLAKKKLPEKTHIRTG